jgi:uncharacterized integral membrane protein
MKRFAGFFTSLILTSWIAIGAIVAIQNYTPVSLRFFGAQSVGIPVGLVLVASLGIGLLFGSLVLSIQGASNNGDWEDLEDER